MNKIHYKKQDPHQRREAKRYERPIPSREFIMDYLTKQGRPVSAAHLQKAFELKDEDLQEALRRRLRAMERDGQLIRNRRGSYALVDRMSLVRGRVVGRKDGYGFLIPDDGGEDLFLPARQMQKVFHGDRVLARVSGKDYKGRNEGSIVEVLEHLTEQVVGRFIEEGGATFVAPTNPKINKDIIIPQGKRGKARNGQMVVADIIAQPQLRRQPLGQIVDVLGEHMAPGLEIEVAIRSYGLPHRWPDEVIAETAHYSKEVQRGDSEGRKDLRDLPLVTIDGEDAKDFDDAVYCEALPTGGWRLFVAIADVSHYVVSNTALDAEAMSRGNSAYFPGRVIPMLPELLSNGLCSLNPNRDRLCMVCELSIGPDGNIKRHRFYDAVMRSHARLTYTQVAGMLAGRDKKNFALLPHLKALEQLYNALSKQRELRGAIEFETIETRIVFGKGRKIDKIVPVKRNVAHRIIEECMLAANVCAANFLLEHKIPALFRVHMAPDAERIEKLRDFLNGFGLKLTGGNDPQPKDFANLLSHVQGRTDASLIQMVMLRSLRQAVYTPDNAGHFGLAYEAYGHFTSPIRRYPDLLVHRAIRHINAHGTAANFEYDANAMSRLGEHCSMTERRADDATRDAIDWLKCEYMLDKTGSEFKGIISSVTGFGVFVELEDIYVEGLIHVTSLKDDYYDFDAVRHRLVGKRTGTAYSLGAPVRVIVARVDLDEREIDFELSG